MGCAITETKSYLFLKNIIFSKLVQVFIYAGDSFQIILVISFCSKLGYFFSKALAECAVVIFFKLK